MRISAVIMYLASVMRDEGDVDVDPDVAKGCKAMVEYYDASDDALSGLLRGEDVDASEIDTKQD